MSYEVDVGNIGSFTLSQGRRHDPETGRQMLTHSSKEKQMSLSRKKSLFMAALAIAACAAIQPAAAQNSGIGGDANTRLLWTATDSSISLWKLDHGLGFLMRHDYGPYDGWLPIAITTTQDNNTTVLWRNTDGTVSLWLVDANLNYMGSHNYGAFSGWIAESLSADTDGSSYKRLIWRETGGQVAVWCIQPDLAYCGSQNYGNFGYDPGGAAAGVAQSSAASQIADAKAAAAMGTTPSIPSRP